MAHLRIVSLYLWYLQVRLCLRERGFDISLLCIQNGDKDTEKIRVCGGDVSAKGVLVPLTPLSAAPFPVQ